MTYIREKFGIVGEMSLATFVVILIAVCGGIGGSYAFALSRTDSIQESLSEHSIKQAEQENKVTAQLSELNGKINLLLDRQGIKYNK